jgi:hypothetical protein
MTDTTTEFESTEAASLIDQFSDEALEAAADTTTAAYTLGACTGLSVCPA